MNLWRIWTSHQIAQGCENLIQLVNFLFWQSGCRLANQLVQQQLRREIQIGGQTCSYVTFSRLKHQYKQNINKTPGICRLHCLPYGLSDPKSKDLQTKACSGHKHDKTCDSCRLVFLASELIERKIDEIEATNSNISPKGIIFLFVSC